jgi:hypothetical protein
MMVSICCARGVEVLEGALAASPRRASVFEGVRALRHVGGVLEQQGIASGQLRARMRAIW